jgi:hypothetical protein
MSKNKIKATLFGIDIKIDVDEVGKNLKKRELERYNHKALQTYKTDRLEIVDQKFKEDNEDE